MNLIAVASAAFVVADFVLAFLESVNGLLVSADLPFVRLDLVVVVLLQCPQLFLLQLPEVLLFVCCLHLAKRTAGVTDAATLPPPLPDPDPYSPAILTWLAAMAGLQSFRKDVRARAMFDD